MNLDLFSIKSLWTGRGNNWNENEPICTTNCITMLNVMLKVVSQIAIVGHNMRIDYWTREYTYILDKYEISG